MSKKGAVTHTLVALVQDHPGVLHRVVSLFRRRGYNIESLTVGHSEMPGISRMTVVVEADVEQVIKQLYRLVEVLKVVDLSDEPTVEREMTLIKIHAPSRARAEIIALANIYGAKIVDVGTQTMVLELAAYPAKVENFISVIRQFGIKEMMRSGRIAMIRGAAAPGVSTGDTPEEEYVGALVAG